MTRAATSTKAHDRARMRAERQDADLRWVLSDPRGRRFLWETMGRFKLNEQTYSANNSEHCFNAGLRNAAIMLLNDVIRVSPDNYLAAQQEAIQLAERERIESTDDEGDDRDH